MKSKKRIGAQVQKTYYDPKTPCERLLDLPNVDESIKETVRKELASLDPVVLLQEIRRAQQALAQSLPASTDTAISVSVRDFMQALSVAWQGGGVRPTHQPKPVKERTWRTRIDPLSEDWETIQIWLHADSAITAKDLLKKLKQHNPSAYTENTVLRTLQRRLKKWRTDRASELVFGQRELLQRPIAGPIKKKSISAKSKDTEDEIG